jgi:hypothetical protein
VRHYFLHLRNHIDGLIDDEGCDYENMDTLRAHVLASARDLMSADLARGIVDLRYRIDAEDALGNIVYTLPFGDAVSIIHD